MNSTVHYNNLQYFHPAYYRFPDHGESVLRERGESGWYVVSPWDVVTYGGEPVPHKGDPLKAINLHYAKARFGVTVPETLEFEVWERGITVHSTVYSLTQEPQRTEAMVRLGLRSETRPSASVPNCDVCGRVQTELGEVRFGPPTRVEGMDGLWCRKLHVCVSCSSGSAKRDVVLQPPKPLEVDQNDPYAKLKLAHYEGRQILWLTLQGEWATAQNPTWKYPPDTYKVA